MLWISTVPGACLPSSQPTRNAAWFAPLLRLLQFTRASGRLLRRMPPGPYTSEVSHSLMKMMRLLGWGFLSCDQRSNLPSARALRMWWMRRNSRTDLALGSVLGDRRAASDPTGSSTRQRSDDSHASSYASSRRQCTSTRCTSTRQRQGKRALKFHASLPHTTFDITGKHVEPSEENVLSAQLAASACKTKKL